jgi:hypothetical protein
MVYIDLHCFVLIVDTVNTSMIFFTYFTFMHCMALSAVWAYYIPETFLCLVTIFATFIVDIMLK